MEYFNEEAAKQLFDRALCGDKDAEGALLTVSGELLIAGKPLPGLLSAFIGNHLLLLGGKGGRTRANMDSCRDLFVVSSVMVACDMLKINPTRNREGKKSDCGCSIVATASKGTPLRLGLRAIEEIWGKRYRFMAAVPRPAKLRKKRRYDAISRKA